MPVGRYINMDPSHTELVISQIQFISFGQSFLAESVITNNTLFYLFIVFIITEINYFIAVFLLWNITNFVYSF